MSAFDRPEGNPGALASAAATLRTVAIGVTADEGKVEDVTGQAFDAWRGARSLDFLTAGTGVQAQLGAAAAAVGDLAEALGDLRTRLRRTIEDVADYKAKADGATDQARTDTAHLKSDDPMVADALAGAARQREHYEQVAQDAKRDYAQQAQTIAARIDAITDRAVPGGHALTPDQLTSKVDGATGITALAGGTTLSAAQAWGALDQWVSAATSAVFADGTVDLTALMPWLTSGMSPTQVSAWWDKLSPVQQLGLLRTRSGQLGNVDGLPAWARDLANREQLPALRARLEAERDDAFAGSQQLYGGPGTAFHLPSSEGQRLEAKLEALDAIEKQLTRGRQLLLLYRRLHIEPSTATVTWMGYDAPQAGEIFSLFDRSASSHHLAQVGGDRLASFYTGINASREHDPHLTALGHSYGSTTTGYALKHPGTGVDDVALFGSPGPGVSNVHDLQAPAGHLCDLAADHDPVAGVPRFGPNPSETEGFEVLSTHADAELGTTGSSGHGQYLVDNSTSQYNLALVTIGATKDVVPDEGHQPGDYAPLQVTP